MKKLIKFCLAIQSYEGYYPGSLTYRLNNPGALRFSIFQDGHKKGFAYFKTYEKGFNALLFDVLLKITGLSKTGLNLNSTILDFFKVYAPVGDGNDPEKYARFVASKVGLNVNDKLIKLITEETKEEGKEKKYILYVVKRGDCLWKIGKKFGIDWEKIFEANKEIIKNPNKIYPGQILKIPVYE